MMPFAVHHCRLLSTKERELTLFQQRQQKYMEVVQLSMDQFTRQNIRFFIEIRGEITIRVQRMDEINREMMKHFLRDQFCENVINSCTAALDESLQRWGGVKNSKQFSEDDDVAFNVYFRTAKNWFDQRKVAILSMFWIPLFVVIEQVTRIYHSKSI